MHSTATRIAARTVLAAATATLIAATAGAAHAQNRGSAHHDGDDAAVAAAIRDSYGYGVRGAVVQVRDANTGRVERECVTGRSGYCTARFEAHGTHQICVRSLSEGYQTPSRCTEPFRAQRGGQYNLNFRQNGMFARPTLTADYPRQGVGLNTRQGLGLDPQQGVGLYQQQGAGQISQQGASLYQQQGAGLNPQQGAFE